MSCTIKNIGSICDKSDDLNYKVCQAYKRDPHNLDKTDITCDYAEKIPKCTDHLHNDPVPPGACYVCNDDHCPHDYEHHTGNWVDHSHGGNYCIYFPSYPFGTYGRKICTSTIYPYP